MSESCPKCGSQKLHPDDRYFICGADSHGQYSGPENCWETALAAATKRAEDAEQLNARLREALEKWMTYDVMSNPDPRMAWLEALKLTAALLAQPEEDR